MSALFKGALTGPSPVDRGRTGSKHHLLVDAAGIFRRLRIRWERRPGLHEAFMHLACAVICQRYLCATRPNAVSLTRD
jgi:hypothetical protein